MEAIERHVELVLEPYMDRDYVQPSHMNRSHVLQEPLLVRKLVIEFGKQL